MSRRLLLLAALLLASADARATRSKGSAAPLQYVGDVLEWRTPNRPDYLRNQQPEDSEHRLRPGFTTY